jgi:hypothetical protein
MYITDSGCTLIGKIKVLIPDICGGLDRPVKVSITPVLKDHLFLVLS